MRGWIEISTPISDGMPVWPGNPPAKIALHRSIARGDAANLTALSLGAHTGTHLDAPRHFLPRGAGIESWTPTDTIGPARVLGIRSDRIEDRDLQGHRIRRGERILLRTANSARRPPGRPPVFVHLAASAARFLAARGVRCVGIDALSVGGWKTDGREVHRVLLSANVWLLEGLDLSRARPGRYDLVAVPLLLLGADGAPARALLRRIS